MEQDRNKELESEIERDRVAIADLRKRVHNIIARRMAGARKKRKADLEKLNQSIKEAEESR